ncbi:MAG: sensor histidine kinase, partial [Pseudomonadota bacterium]
MRSIGGKTPRRATVIGARWVSIVGQTLAVAAAAFVFDVQASYAGFILVLALGAVINAAFAIGLSDSQRLTDGQTAWALTADLAQIAALLALAGGVLNPFAIFLLGPATVAATVLSSRSAILVGAASAVAVVALAIAHLPLAFADGTVVEPSFERRLAAVTALLAALGFVPLYARRVAVEAFDMSAALAAAQMALEQEQRVSAIGAMAAAVAHELGTPLATIKLS